MPRHGSSHWLVVWVRSLLVPYCIRPLIVSAAGGIAGFVGNPGGKSMSAFLTLVILTVLL